MQRAAGSPRPRIWRLLLVLLVALLPGGCGQAPDAEDTRAIVEARLQAAFADPVVAIASFRRLGSNPLPADGTGTTRRIVYYNARLVLERDYAFGDWEALNPAALANLLGATERGLEGVRPGGNRAGDELRVRGSVTFRAVGGDWVPTGFVAPASAGLPPADGTALPARARELAEGMMALLNVPPGQDAAARAIVAEELDAAHRLIALRLDRLQRTFIVAGGPEGGEYDLVARIFAEFATRSGIRTTALSTDGSFENLALLADRAVDLALVQNDVAAMAHAGEGPFTGRGPMPDIRALGTLFPEPVHIVVRGDSDIRSLADLPGRRVDIGLPGSGSRPTALAVLAAHGLGPDDFAEATDLGAAGAAAALATGDLDAFIAVINAPARLVQRLAAGPGIRLLPLREEAIAALSASPGGLVRLVLPPGTYPGQRVAVPTVAATALLAARADTPDAEIRATLAAIYERIHFIGSGSAAGALISRDRATTGIAIPMHPAAAAFLEQDQPATP